MEEEREIAPLTAEDARIVWTHVLTKAVEDFKNGRKAQSEKSLRAYRDAERWIWSDDEEFPSFISICEVLELNPNRVRRALLGDELRQQGPKGRSQPDVVEPGCDRPR